MVADSEEVRAGWPNLVLIEDVIPECTNCIPQRIESHPHLKVVRCANCKMWLG
jgi:hypothetical protein